MQFKNSLTGVFLIAGAALLGVGLFLLPGWVIDNYERFNRLGPGFGVAYLVVIGIAGALVLGSIGWTLWTLWGRSLSKKLRRARRDKNPSELSSDQQQKEIEENLELVGQMRDADGNVLIRGELDPLVRDLEAKREGATIEIVVFGTISSGKSSVLNNLAGEDVFQTDVRGGTTISRNEIPWPGIDRVFLVDTPGLGEVDGEKHVLIAADSARDADLILLVVDGPLRESEFRLLEKLGQMEKRVIVCLNKSDWYSDQDRDKLLGQIRRQLDQYVREADVVAIRAEQSTRTRQRVMADGSQTSEQVDIPADIEPLALRMLDVVKRERKNLLLANVLLQSRGLVEKARDKVKQNLDDRAHSLVNKYMWGAGGLAAASPWPVVDLFAGCAVSTKMIVDLAEIYHQQVDMETAGKWLGEMAKNLVSVVGVSGASVGVAAVVSSLVKSVPMAGWVAGAALQGIVQALITKWIGYTFVQYFRDEMRTPEGGLAALARRQWQEITRLDELRKLVQVARGKMKGDSDE